MWLMMDLPCARYLKAKLPLWMPTLRAHGGLADWDGSAFLELGRMSAATMEITPDFLRTFGFRV